MNDFLRKNLKWMTVGFDLICLDLFTKWIAKTQLQEPLSVWADTLVLQASKNQGVAFSVPIPNLVMIVVTPLLIGAGVVGIWRYCKIESGFTKAVLALFIAGSVGNYVNRIWEGGVIDFIDFSFWPSFNLADSYLSVAAFILVAFYGRIVRSQYGESTNHL